MLCSAVVIPSSYRPVLQALAAPVRVIYAIFIQVIGCLLSCLGLNWGDALQNRGEQILIQTEGLFRGLWAYGRRFVVLSDNFESNCRGSCYWLIDQHFRHPEKPLPELALAFEDGAPKEAIALHCEGRLPPKLTQQFLRSADGLPDMPQLPPGVYTVVVGFSKADGTRLKGHRMALFLEDEPFLFEPSTGLSRWENSDWKPLLEMVSNAVRSEVDGTITVELYGMRAADQ